MNIKLWASAACLVTFLSQSCVDHNLPEPEVGACSVTVSFADEVNPIINTSCAIPGCHNGDNGAPLIGLCLAISSQTKMMSKIELQDHQALLDICQLRDRSLTNKFKRSSAG